MARRAKKTNQDDPTTFPEKWHKILDKLPEFKEIADAASTDELKKIIVTCEGNIYTIEKDKEACIELNAAKELVKEHGAGFRDAAKAQMTKIKYALFLLEGRGVDLDSKE